MPASSLVTSRFTARRSRTDSPPLRYRRPLSATFALPAAVRGPVLCAQGLFTAAAARSRSRPASVSGPRRRRLSRPAATRAGDFGFNPAGESAEPPADAAWAVTPVVAVAVAMYLLLVA